MKLLFSLITFTLMLSLVSCSSKKTETEESITESVGLGDENEYANEDEMYEDKYSSDTIEESVAEETPVPEEEYIAEKAPSQISFQSGELTDYIVEKGDTLMLLAFKFYGDYSKWREIKNTNPQLSSDPNLTIGDRLQIQMPEVAFNWRPDGEPYLIRRNDTLQIISTNLYDTTKKWKHLYEHNKPLIKDPNIIFAGFTIYYLPSEMENRDPANE